MRDEQGQQLEPEAELVRSATIEAVDLEARLAQVEAQIAKKQGKTDRRSASFQALLKERTELQAQIELQKKGSL